MTYAYNALLLVVQCPQSLGLAGVQQAISPAAALTPDGLPPCGLNAVGSCKGDGSTLKERLEALQSVGKVNVSGVSRTNDSVAGDTAVCGAETVSACKLHGFQPLCDVTFTVRWHRRLKISAIVRPLSRSHLLSPLISPKYVIPGQPPHCF